MLLTIERDTHSAAVLFGPPFLRTACAAVHGNRGMLLGKTSLRRPRPPEQRQAQGYGLLRRRPSKTRRVASREMVPWGISSPLQDMIPTFETASAMTIPSNFNLLFGQLDTSTASSSTTPHPSSLSAVAVPKFVPMPFHHVVDTNPLGDLPAR